jgi:hypothetical protein
LTISPKFTEKRIKPMTRSKLPDPLMIAGAILLIDAVAIVVSAVLLSTPTDPPRYPIYSATDYPATDVPPAAVAEKKAPCKPAKSLVMSKPEALPAQDEKPAEPAKTAQKRSPRGINPARMVVNHYCPACRVFGIIMRAETSKPERENSAKGKPKTGRSKPATSSPAPAVTAPQSAPPVDCE